MIIGFIGSNQSCSNYFKLKKDILSIPVEMILLDCLKSEILDDYKKLNTLVVYLPGSNFEIVGRYLKQFKCKLPHVPIVIVVNNASLSTALLSINTRAWCYVDMSLSPNSLRNILHNLEVLLQLQVHQAERDVFVPDKTFKGVKFQAHKTENALISAVINYIHEHIDEKLDSRTLANVVGIESRTLLNRFKDAKGEVLREYVKKHRIKRARHLLVETRNSIEQIAVEVGFTDAAHFVKKFKLSMGVTPGQYRKSLLMNQCVEEKINRE